MLLVTRNGMADAIATVVISVGTYYLLKYKDEHDVHLLQKLKNWLKGHKHGNPTNDNHDAQGNQTGSGTAGGGTSSSDRSGTQSA